MKPSRSSRYLRQEHVVVTDRRGTHRIRGQRDTSVFADEQPKGTTQITVEPGSGLPLTARRHLGRHQFWWILADMNPQVFYPLDLADDEELNVPPLRTVESFRRRQTLR